MDRIIYDNFARLLDYPTKDLDETANQLTNQLTNRLQAHDPPAAKMLKDFQRFLGNATPGQLEELYTSTFDLQGAVYPYIGHQLFSETYLRSRFMRRLNQEYCLSGFSKGSELPDHIAVVLRYLGLGYQDEFSQALIKEGLIPALEKMMREFNGNAGNPYNLVLQTLWQVLNENISEETLVAGDPVVGGEVDA